MNSNSFSWKEIEQKPENAEIARLLIDSGVIADKMKTTESKVEQPMNVLLELIEKKELKRWFPEEEEQENGKKQNNKKKQKNADRIRAEVEKNKIKSDLELFKLNDDLSLRTPIFFYNVNNYLYILWWCHVLITRIETRQNRGLNPLLLLDATLSIDRLLSKGIITNEFYLKGFYNISKEANSYMNDKFYQLLFQNPKMILSCSFQSSSKEVSLYKEQKVILNTIKEAIEKDEPLLLGNQLPTGQGKTFLASVLARVLSENRKSKDKKCVLFACSNELVNLDVASCSLLGAGVHLWMAKMIREEGKSEANVLVRPYKSCFPNTWKKVYKQKEDDNQKNGRVEDQWKYYLKKTEKIPDIIICDLDACKNLLEIQKSLGNPFVAYIDEFISDEKSNKLMASICENLPRQTVLLSSVLPKFEYIPSIVNHFCESHSTTKELCCKRVSAVDISIPCCVIDKSGKIRFPHHEVETREELGKLIEEMKTNPRIRRTYSPQHVFYWMKELNSILPDELSFRKHFPRIGSIQMRKITEYVLSLLEYLYNHFDLLDKFKEYKPQVFEPIDKNEIFEKQCYMYEPKTLVITNNPAPEVSKLTDHLFESTRKHKISKLLEGIDRQKTVLQNKLESLKKTKSTATKKVNPAQMEQKCRDITEEMETLQLEIPKDFQLNHREHYKRYHGDVGKYPKSVGLHPPIYVNENYIDAFSNDELYQIMTGIGTYDVKCQTDFQRKLIMILYHHLQFLVSGKEIVYGTNLSGLINIFIDDDFAQNVSISELYQLMGRVGRVGRSYNANIITTNEETVKRLLSLEDNIETYNDIETIFANQQKDINEKIKYYTTAIEDSLEEGRRIKAIDFFEEMLKKKVQTPSSLCNTMLQLYCQMNDIKRIEKLLEYIEDKKILKSVDVCEDLILLFKKNFMMKKANIIRYELEEILKKK